MRIERWIRYLRGAEFDYCSRVENTLTTNGEYPLERFSADYLATLIGLFMLDLDGHLSSGAKSLTFCLVKSLDRQQNYYSAVDDDDDNNNNKFPLK